MSFERRRLDLHPTHHHDQFAMRAGKPLPFGTTVMPNGINFSIASRHATACTLVLFRRGAVEPFGEIPFPPEFRVGDVFTMIVFDLDFETFEYGYRFKGPWDPALGHRFDQARILLDPYAKAISGCDVWGQPPRPADVYPYRARMLTREDFDWEDDRQLEIPFEELVIYEMHVRGFTAHPSSGVEHPGTFAAIHEKIPYLKALGVNAIELMPIFEFDELDNRNVNPQTGQPLINYWGYNTVGFFAPKAGYGATGRQTQQSDELKHLIKTLHRNGIEVLLDVVFNHTAEGPSFGPTISYRGIDNKTWYMLKPDGTYQDFAGTGNTLNCNNPIVRNHILDCLHYWVSDYHVDGFRFDLAAILGRDPDGSPLTNPPLIETLAYDSVLAGCKLIAEAWDASGLYQVGHFPAYGRWAEWNGRYRDTMRRLLRGDRDQTHDAHLKIAGSPHLYQRGPTASINFITAHDGFTLRDLFSYNLKHNEANGEESRDGANDNYSWNCGVEGATDDPAVLALRRRLMKNALTLLFMSQGVPMLLMGDERARTQQGNNNPYCHDGELTWLDWQDTPLSQEMLRFTTNIIAFRRAHAVLRSPHHLSSEPIEGQLFPELTWHGVDPFLPDHSEGSRTLACMLGSNEAAVYFALNVHWEAHRFVLPPLPQGWAWHRFVDTSRATPDDIAEVGAEPQHNELSVLLQARSTVILVGRSR